MPAAGKTASAGIRTPVVSVVIPAFNLSRFLPSCLASLRAQSFSDWEGIVIDDGSTDGTAEGAIRLSDPRIQVVRQANLGVSAARNRGLAQARGRYVMFLDGDDLLHPTALERLRTALDAEDSLVAAFGTLRKVLEDGSAYPQQKPLALSRYPTGDVLAHVLRENFLANGGQVLLRTTVVHEVGGFAASLRLSEDWEFWCRIAAQGPVRFIGNEPEVFCLRTRSGSSSSQLASTWCNYMPSIDAVLGNPDLRRRFSPRQWAKLSHQVTATHLWEAGRVNFTIRRFAEARQLMLMSLWHSPRPKRVVLFGLAQLSQLLNVSIVARLRFQDHDQAGLS